MSTLPVPPDQAGGSLVNLVAELELRLRGGAAAPPLHPDVSARIPEAETYVLAMFDGLGAAQLGHPAAGALAGAHAATIDAPFPSTTTVSLATVATGTAARTHGLIGHLMYLPEHGVFNSLKWVGRNGRPVEHDTATLLPAPNLWERLAAAGFEPITIQPGHFLETPLSRALYRGCRFEPVWTHDEMVAATVDLAARPGRLLLLYMGEVDFAAHLFGQRSPAYVEALRAVAGVWEAIALALPAGAAMVGTADHGHVDFPEHAKHHISSKDTTGIDVYGDPRALFLKGEGSAAFAQGLPGTWVPLADARTWWGPEPEHPELPSRLPDGVVLADPDVLLLPGHMDRRLIGYHGGLTRAELEIPVLVAG